MSILYILQMICLFIYLYKRLRPIKLFMLIFSSYNQKVANSYHPPKNKKKIISSFADDNKYTNNNNSKNSKIKLRNIGTNLNEIKSKVPFLNKGNKDFNSMHKLLVKDNRKIILANNYTSNINIQNKIININNQNKMNKKRLQKGILLQESNKKSKLLSIKSNKNLFYKDIGNKSIKGNKKSKYLYNMETLEYKNKNKSNLNIFKNLRKLYNGDDNLQNMDYEQAIVYDKRALIKMYWAFLVDTQIILETFCTENNLTLFVIKLSYFIFTLQISFFLNAFFYTDEYISNAYHNNGVLDFFTGLPKSIYSFLATMIITNILSILSNSKNELILLIRKKRENKNYLHFINIKLKKLRNKLIVYFILVFILGLLFLYYVTAFCSVYYYSQKYWFIGCLESFGMDFLNAIFICIFLALFRYLSIKKHIKCFYILPNIISTFL